MHTLFQNILMRAADAYTAHRPQPAPSPGRLAQCRLVSHRGQHDNQTCMENTIDAFQRAGKAGVWGIELDIRWTRDLHPVVFHDADLARLYGTPDRIDALSLEGLRRRFEAIPSLADVVQRFGRQLHLMIEIKVAPWRDTAVQSRRLERLLQPLTPARDYHVMTMAPQDLAHLAWLPDTARVAIAGFFTGPLSQWVLTHGWGGLCGHYLRLPTTMAQRHHDREQRVGTGYAGSQPCLWRELNRGIDWIFTNDAVGLQAIVDAATKGT